MGFCVPSRFSRFRLYLVQHIRIQIPADFAGPPVKLFLFFRLTWLWLIYYICTQIKASLSSLRQRLWREYRALDSLLRTMTSQGPLTPGSFHLMRRKCGKPSCRCARGELHPVWVLTRSQKGEHKLYSVPDDQRSRVRALAGAWRRYHRARARLVKQTAALLALADRVALAQKEDWP